MNILNKLLSLQFITLFVLFFFQACNWSRFEPTQLIVESDSILLEWDPPASIETQDLPVKAYKIYYRIHDMPCWSLLAVIPAERYPKHVIYHSEVGNGPFDFAVSAVILDNRESNRHTSLDLSADPVGGWYVLWVIKRNE
jgi:hypothetical protein